MVVPLGTEAFSRLVAVASVGQSLTILRDFTADRELLKQVVHRLRRKLLAAGGQGAWIEYIAGAGYAITASPSG